MARGLCDAWSHNGFGQKQNRHSQQKPRMHSEVAQERHFDPVTDSKTLECGQRQEREPSQTNGEKCSSHNAWRVLLHGAEALFDTIGWAALGEHQFMIGCLWSVHHWPLEKCFLITRVGTKRRPFERNRD